MSSAFFNPAKHRANDPICLIYIGVDIVDASGNFIPPLLFYILSSALTALQMLFYAHGRLLKHLLRRHYTSLPIGKPVDRILEI